ncbi:MAG: indole-3-glycerol phosphate synthase TrpC [Lachnospiraceae bacterium]|nr:indole-3-glycerol phosphate synthase TrpC [Lachnospiraceae bacterium]
MTILDEIAAFTKTRVKADSEKISFSEIKEMALSGEKADGKAFYDALKKPGLSFICEVKKASPSKGIISPDFPYLDIAKAYEEAGAECISCLTEPKWFLGSDEIFKEIRGTVKSPMIRKDFVVDEYQLYQAKLLGANAVLLICAILDTKTVARYLEICDTLGLSALVEAHTEEEIISAKTAGAKIIGVNNRNLKDFSVDFSNAKRLRDMIPQNALYVVESGVTGPSDMEFVKTINADAALIGEAFMRAEDKKAFLKSLREVAG